MKATQYLAAVKAKLNITSDYKLAKALGISTQAVSKYQSGKNIPGNLVAFKVAEILGDQPSAVIAEFEIERAEMAENADEAEEWKGMLKRFGGAALSILFAAGFGGISNADARLASSLQVTQDIHRIKRRKKKASPWAGLLPPPLRLAC